MKISVLDAKTLGDDLDLSIFNKIGEAQIFATTLPEQVDERTRYADVVVLNKIKFNAETIKHPENIKLVCVTATGFDNIDLDFCRKNNIGVCNVVGYSTDSVAQVTAAMALSLKNHISEYDECSKSGDYTRSGVQNRLTPVYHELSSMTWGIVGYGNIGKKVADIAKALGCKIIVYKKTPIDGVHCVDIDELCRQSDIISIHTPLNEETKNLINKNRIKSMKSDAVVINVARGAVCDEDALCEAILNKKIGGLGVDVFSVEPFPENHCYNKLKDCKNVIITPHMAWGAYEARQRCVNEVTENIKAFFEGKIRNRVDL